MRRKYDHNTGLGPLALGTGTKAMPQARTNATRCMVM